ncbi:MAG TPA: hypothetical protein VGK96_21705, partial [Candidatus Sulfotelmatobacter sp.]
MQERLLGNVHIVYGIRAEIGLRKSKRSSQFIKSNMDFKRCQRNSEKTHVGRISGRKLNAKAGFARVEDDPLGNYTFDRIVG